ncbi:MAG: Gldg family protein [Planctomycetota bacterium]
MRNVCTLAAKEFRSTFRTPIAYVIIALFLAVMGWLFFYYHPFFQAGEASLRAFFGELPLVFLFFIPALTMRLWAEERKVGTIEILLTLPLRSWQVVLGKFLGALALIASMLALTFPLPVVVFYLGNPDPGPIIGGYLGAIFLGAAYAAIGLFASGLTENQIIAFLLGVVLGFFLFILDFAGLHELFPSLAEVLERLSLRHHFQSIGRGVIDSRDILYYLSVIGLFLVMNSCFLRTRSRAQLVTVLLTSGILVTLNVIGLAMFVRIDLTEDQLNTLHDDTKKLLSRVADDLDITVYLPPPSEMPDRVATVPRDLRDLIDEFRIHANEKTRIRILDSSREEVRREAAAAGVEPSSAVETSPEEVAAKVVYLGAIVNYGDKSELIRSIKSAQSLEYDLALAIARVTREFEPVVAFNSRPPLAPDLPPEIRAQIEANDPFRPRHDLDGDYRLVKAVLERQFRVETVTLANEVDEDIDCLVLANPEILDDAARFHADQYLMRGGKIILLLDGVHIDKRGEATPRSLSNDAWLASYGVTVEKNLVFDDAACFVGSLGKDARGKPIIGRFPWLVQVLPPNLDPAHPLTRNLNELLLTLTASLRLQPPGGVEATILARSTDKAWARGGSFLLEAQSASVPTGERRSYDLVAVLTGYFPSHFAAGAPSAVHAEWAKRAEPEERAGVPPVSAPDEPGQGAQPVASTLQDERAGDEGKGEGVRVIRIPEALPGEAGGTDEAGALEPLAIPLLASAERPGVLLVLGSSEFIAVSRRTSGVLFLQNALEWMTVGDELLGIRSRRSQQRRFEQVGEVEESLLKAAGIGLVALLVLIWGLAFHLHSRRRPRQEVCP